MKHAETVSHSIITSGFVEINPKFHKRLQQQAWSRYFLFGFWQITDLTSYLTLLNIKCNNTPIQYYDFINDF